jgi:hypothetical protein
MHERDIEYTCPLGSDCETIKNNQMHRCRWYVKIEGADPNTAKPTEEWSCAIAWMPLLQIESSMHTRQGNVGIESLRNEVASSRESEEEYRLLKHGIIQQNTIKTVDPFTTPIEELLGTNKIQEKK